MGRGRAKRLLILIAAAAFLNGCGRVEPRPDLAAAIREVLEQPDGAIAADDESADVPKAVWADLRTFYRSRENQPAWITDADTAVASHVLDVVRTAPAHGFVAADYGETDLASRIASLTVEVEGESPDPLARARELAELDVRLTTALLAFARDVSQGRKNSIAGTRNKVERAVPDFAGTLAQTVADPAGWIDAIRPPHPEYAALQNALASLHHLRDRGGWGAVPQTKFVLGEMDPALVALRQRLAAGGHLAAGAASSGLPFSEDDAAAVRAFQNLHGLTASGAVDAPTLAALNVPLDERIRQVALNLERWRAMPDELGARHFIVNIPSFHLIAREQGKPVLDIRVVVGKPTNKTPVFSSVMSTVVFSPYWNIPSSIVEGETAPAIARDPAYLAKNNIEVLDAAKATPVDYADIDWSDPAERRRLAFRQKPGPGNALGFVKFLFPNEHDVYIHDTPADRLFAKTSRALSHGCVRVELPEVLARYVLRGDTKWDDERINAAMHAGAEQHVRLNEPIPVHLVYFTAWVDDHGGLHFRPDVYGYDRPRG